MAKAGKTTQIQTLTLLEPRGHGWRLPHPHPALPPQRVQCQQPREWQRCRPRLVHPGRARLDLAGGEHHQVAQGPAAAVPGGQGRPHLIEKGGEGIKISSGAVKSIHPTTNG